MYLDLIDVEMNTMGLGYVTPRVANAVEISNVAQATFLLDQLAFPSVLGRVRMNHHAALACEAGNVLEQLARATDRKARRETIPDTAICCPVPLVQQRKRFLYRTPGLFPQSRRNLIAFIHHAFADSGAKTSFLNNLKNFAGVIHCFHRERAGGSTLDEFGNSETR